jgi:hypothetical protein
VDLRTATPDFSDMSIALVCMVALGDGVQGVWRWIWSSRFSAWTIYSWRGASVDDEREEVGKRRSVDVS